MCSRLCRCTVGCRHGPRSGALLLLRLLQRGKEAAQVFHVVLRHGPCTGRAAGGRGTAGSAVPHLCNGHGLNKAAALITRLAPAAARMCIPRSGGWVGGGMWRRALWRGHTDTREATAQLNCTKHQSLMPGLQLPAGMAAQRLLLIDLTHGGVKVEGAFHGGGHAVQAAARQQRCRLAAGLGAVLQPAASTWRGANRGWASFARASAARRKAAPPGRGGQATLRHGRAEAVGASGEALRTVRSVWGSAWHWPRLAHRHLGAPCGIKQTQRNAYTLLGRRTARGIEVKRSRGK